MTELDFDYLCTFLKARSGLSLGAEKRYLIESRLSLVCRRHDVGTIPDRSPSSRGGGTLRSRRMWSRP
jgi:chemotaxis protein methyltransferase CheR